MVGKLGQYIFITSGKHNTQDCVEGGLYPFFDRSSAVKSSNRKLFDCEAVIFPGEGKNFTPRYYSGKFDLHQRCYCLTPKAGVLCKYLYYNLLFHRDYFARVATGSTVPSLRLAHFLDMPVTIHPIDEQRHIVGTTSSLP